MTIPRLHVLLSTFNGETYLEELLQSILHQSYSNFQLHIRDDGSGDTTPEILRKYASLDKRIVIELGTNIGVQASFYEVLEKVDDAHGLYAFCDQDDIWQEHKLTIAVDALNQSDNQDSTLYCSRLSCVDSENRFLYDSALARDPGAFNALVENSAIGCTCVFGHQLRCDFLRAKPEDMIMHDWWLYLCAASNGTIIYDKVPRIRYRQHLNTATPREPGISRLKNRFLGLLSRVRKGNAGLDSLNQANKFVATYPECTSDIKNTLHTLNNLHGYRNMLKRVEFALKTRMHRNDRLENIALKLVIIFDLH